MFSNLNKKSYINDKGSAILWMLVSSGAVALAAAFVVNSINSKFETQRNQIYRQSLAMIRENLQAMFDSDAIWSQIVTNNPSLNCLQTAAAVCDPGTFGNFQIRNADGSIYYNPGVASNGFAPDGTPCNTFDAVNGNDECPYRLTFTVQCAAGVVCPATQLRAGHIVAIEPQLAINSQIVFQPRANSIRGIINTSSDKYVVNFTRGSRNKTLSQYCRTIGGVFNQLTNDCDANTESSDFTCPVGQAFLGFDGAGAPICQPDVRYDVRCNDRSAVLGIRADGGLVCGAY